MPTYQAPTRDALFIIKEVLQLEAYSNLPGFESATPDIVDAVIEEGGKFAAEVLAPLNDSGDAQGCTRHADGSVTTPDGFKEAHKQFREAGWGTLVLGSETQVDAALVRHFAGGTCVALSLDFRGPSFQGPPELLDDTDCWPQTVIAMTLARVGSGAGPDLDRLGGVRDAAPGRKVYAAGGVRDIDDLITLKRAGIAGALVASCLHDGRLRGGDIATL
jgi:hypothetical protein